MPFPMTYTRRTAWPGRLLRLLPVILACALPVAAQARQDNRLRRVEVVPRHGATSVKLFFQDPPDYRIDLLPGRVRLTVKDTGAPRFKKLRSYSDGQLTGIFCYPGYDRVTLVIPVRDRQPVVQAVGSPDSTLLSLEIGSSPQLPQRADILPGREGILSGTERFVREFQVPSRSVLPSQPTDAKLLKGLMPGQEMQLFQRGEGFLYRQQANDALEVFKLFLAKEPAVRALAWYRQGEALALLDRTPEALAAFRQGEALWPAYLQHSADLTLSYAEVRAKSGDFAGGRALLGRLMDRFGGTPYAAPLLARLAQMYEWQGEKTVADGMYRTLIAHAQGTEAAARAALKLADRQMFTVPRHLYPKLLARYQAVYDAAGGFALRDEALFKMALLQALYGPSQEALKASLSYSTCYPRGIFSTVINQMREELLLPVYREMYTAHDQAGLATLVQDNRQYLERCFSDPEFAPRVAEAFRAQRQLSREIDLFSYLNERNWAAGSVPFMSATIVEDALSLGNASLAESTARAFLCRFPGDSRANRVREQLARLSFEKGELREVAALLSFLTGKGGKAEFPESYYYLGKAQAAAGDQRGAQRALASFIAAAPAGSSLLPDGYFSMAASQMALREYPAALETYRQGAKVATGETADQFHYKMGELCLQLKLVKQAKQNWETVANRGGGGTWAMLAGEALRDLDWRLKISSQLP